MDRRNFIRRSFGAGALLATGQLALRPSTVSAAAPATGFQVGQVVPKVRGLDQYDRQTSLQDNAARWTLLDVCPWWCSPCRESAVHHAAFSAYMNGQGIPFHVLSIVVENLFGQAANREDAERWARTFGLERDVVMHCAGDAASPLRQVMHALWQANQPPYPPSYPTYAIIDPSGVIRYYQPGSGLNALQSALASLTGVPLTGNWPEVGNSTIVQGLGPRAAVLPARVTGVRSDGPTIDELLVQEVAGQLVYLHGDLLISGFNAGDPGFSLDVPLSVRFMPSAPPSGGVYRLMTLPGVSIAPDVPEGVTYTGGFIAGSAQLTSWPDGSLELVCDPFRSFLPADADVMPWAFVRHNVYFEPVAPYGASIQLEADVAAAALPADVVLDVRTLLQAVRDKLRLRDFAAAAEKAARAAQELEFSGADLTLRMNARSLANLDGSASAGVRIASATALSASGTASAPGRTSPPCRA